MLILCYGMAKGGSTLAFELVKGMLESVGHTQARLPDGPVEPDHPINYIKSIDGERVDALLSAVGERWIAVKTHAGFRPPLFPVLEALQQSGQARIIASYRDPRDVCLSLVDAGTKAVAEGRHGSFERFADKEIAIADVQAQTDKFRRWASVHGALRLDYETVAFAPHEAIDLIERTLDIACDRDAALHHAFEQAFTQKNKMKRRRFEDELADDEKHRLTEMFAEFLREVCEARNDAWFASYREHMLIRAERMARQRA
jgi:hypothetical protein